MRTRPSPVAACRAELHTARPALQTDSREYSKRPPRSTSNSLHDYFAGPRTTIFSSCLAKLRRSSAARLISLSRSSSDGADHRNVAPSDAERYDPIQSSKGVATSTVMKNSLQRWLFENHWKVRRFLPDRYFRFRFPRGRMYLNLKRHRT